MKFFSVFFVIAILVAAVCQAAEVEDPNVKKSEKRGIFGFGHGYHGGYGGYGHGYGFGYPVYHGAAYPAYHGHGFYPSHGYHHYGFH